MGSIQKTPAVKLPTVKLDGTLAELYKRASPSNSHLRLGMIFCGVNSGLDLNHDFPRNRKFLYQDSPFNTVPRQQLTKDNHELRKSLSIKYLSLIPQRDAFISGQTPVILFNQGQTQGQIDHDRREAEETLSVLDPSQQPELIFCPGPSKIPFQENNIHKISYKIIPDGIYQYPLTHDPETHWYLNSKAALAHSGLPTPRTQIIDIEGHSESPSECCTVCTAEAKGSLSSNQIPSIPANCTGTRYKWLTTQTNKILTAITNRKPPFVLKNQQTFGGAGTWVITTPEQKASLLSDLSSPDGPIHKLLPLITPENKHLRPGSFLVSDLVKDAINDYGVTFLVTEHSTPGSDKAIFLAASEQMTDGNGAWLGSTIDYTNQDMLYNKFKSLIDQTAGWISKHGYFGPVGIDILETKTAGQTATENGDTTAYHIVDLNVRISGSLALPFLRGHFERRWLNCASSFSIRVKGTRGEFLERWRGEFEEGRMLILSWYEDLEDGVSFADVVVAGEGRGELQGLMGRVREGSEEVIF